MRLIDADKIKQSVTNEMLKAELNSPVYCTLECVIADIDSQPTAYDVDKVVEQLEADKRELYEIIESGVRDIYKNTNYGYFTALNRAIEIIEAEMKE